MPEGASKLVLDFLPALANASQLGPVLDLACGGGRNGLVLLREGMDVVFADRNADSLQGITQHIRQNSTQHGTQHDIQHSKQAVEGAGWGEGTIWQVDLEEPSATPLAGQRFGAILVFRYLHRPLFEQIRDAVLPGGLVVYETFTVDQAQYGRPTNPDFLLRHGELASHFPQWEVLFAREKIEDTTDGSGKRATACFVARKPG